MDLLSSFIKMNKRLVHLDLSNCGMSYVMLEQFGKTLKRAKGLRAIHLSGNPGLQGDKNKEKLVNWLVHRMSGIKVNTYRVIDFRKMPTNKEFQNKFREHHMHQYNKMNARDDITFEE